VDLANSMHLYSLTKPYEGRITCVIQSQRQQVLMKKLYFSVWHKG